MYYNHSKNFGVFHCFDGRLNDLNYEIMWMFSFLHFFGKFERRVNFERLKFVNVSDREKKK